MFSRFIQLSLWISGLAVSCFLYGFLVEPTQLKVRNIVVVQEDWPHDPMRIAFMADLHMGGEHISTDRVAEIVGAVMAQEPDLILLGGDFIDGHLSQAQTSEVFDRRIYAGFNELGALGAGLGVYAVIGNHDVWYGIAPVTDQLEAQGINVLASETQVLNNGVCIAGYSDHDTQRSKQVVINDCPSLQATALIALMHSPDSLPFAGKADLALAGHTHGGQINIPGIGRRVTSTQMGKPYAYGLTSYFGLPVYITSGIGTSILPARFRAPPEIVLITLRGEAPESGPQNLSP